MILNTLKPIIYDGFFFKYMHVTCILCADDCICSLNITSNLTKISFEHWCQNPLKYQSVYIPVYYTYLCLCMNVNLLLKIF